MAAIARIIGALFLLPFAMIFARYAAVPFASNPGPLSVLLLVYGGYLILAAYVVAFVAIGYQLSKHKVGSAILAGALCAAAYIVLSIFALVMWKIVSGMVASFSGLFFANLAGAFVLGAGGFVLRSRISADTK